jgi:iron complex outermembrane receptor protein
MFKTQLFAATMFITASVAASHAAAQAPTSPQAQAPAQLGEVLITAQKRTENIQAVAKPVQVVGQESLRQNNVTTLANLSQLVPSITAGNGGSLSIRGVATGASTVGAQSKVGVTLDDVPQPTRANLANYLQDVQQIEVLPGPQGTLSGRNATGGLVNIVSKSPTSYFTADVRAAFTSDMQRQFSGYVAGPINDQLAASLSIYNDYFQGLAQNVQTGTWASTNVTGIRGKLRYRPIEKFTLTLTGFYQQVNSVTSGAVVKGSTIPTTSITNAFDIQNPKRNLNQLLPGETFSATNTKWSSPRDGTQRATDMGGIVKAEYDLGFATLSSISSILGESTPFTQDITQLTLVNMNLRSDYDGFAHVKNKLNYLTEEVRLTSPTDGKLQYVGGVFTSHTVSVYNYTRLVLPVDWHRWFPQDSFAVYGHASYAITPKLTIQGGLRYEDDHIKYLWNFKQIGANTTTAANGTVLVFPVGQATAVTTQASNSANFVNYDASVQYHLTDDIMGYVTYGSASQGPIYDAEDNVTAISGPLKPLPQESVKDWEFGVKSQWLDHRLTLNLNFFNSDFLNYQQQTSVVSTTDPNAVPIFKLAAVGAVRTRGAELSANAIITDAFRINGQVSYDEATIISYPFAACYTTQTVAQGCVTVTPPGEFRPRAVQLSLSGKPLASAPKWRMVWNANYTKRNLIADYDLFINGTVTYTSAQNTDLLGNPANNLTATTYMNAGIGLRNSRYTAQVQVLNLFGSTYETFGNNAPLFMAPGATVLSRNLNRLNSRYAQVTLSAHF